MNNDDLLQVKNIGKFRMKLLNSHGITTIQQLNEMPLEDLEQIKSVGRHYAKLIKDAVNEIFGQKEEPSAPAEKVQEEENAQKSDRNLDKIIKDLNIGLKKAKEKLKPLQKKKHVKLFLDVKKNTGRLKTRMQALSRRQKDLSDKQKKKILKKADALNMMLKKVGKDKKTKIMKGLLKEIQSFYKVL